MSAVFAGFATCENAVVVDDFTLTTSYSPPPKPNCRSKYFQKDHSTEAPITSTVVETPPPEASSTEIPSGPCSDNGPHMITNSTWQLTDAKSLTIKTFRSCCEWCWSTSTCKGLNTFRTTGTGEFIRNVIRHPTLVQTTW
ncbi:unnamed protein product [Phytophthora lilii]|uniref:Unnamed protein product n=1 Tax=Phytophthora lilii TaxID=2077276 RepID=A0A9W6WS32_9STRA|nr:unnamed protein product [Phytophthora lilii]